MVGRSGIVAGLRAMGLAAMVLAAGCSGGKPAAPPPPEVPVIKLAGTDTPIYREWVGATLGAADVQIRARVTGTVEKMHFTEGGLVKKDQLLYSIDANELDERVASARAQVAEAKTRLAETQADLARYRPLAAINAVSQRDLDAAIANEGAARGAVDAAQAGLNVAQINRSYADVRAPIAGYIGISEVKVGDLVGPATAKAVLNTVSQIDPIRVRFSISEREYLDFARRFGTPGTPGTTAPTPDRKSAVLQLILADGSVLPYPGKVLSIQRQIDVATGSLAIDSEFPNPDQLIRPGQFGRVRAAVEDRRNAVLVPQSAIRELQGQYQAFVVGPDDTVELRGIEVGSRIGNKWLVEKGLNVGDRLILAGTQRFKQGMKIVPKAAEAEPPPEPAAQK